MFGVCLHLPVGDVDGGFNDGCEVPAGNEAVDVLVDFVDCLLYTSDAADE